MPTFETKYGIGDVQYAPRCYKRIDERDEMIDDERTLTITRTFYEGVVKKKFITAIHAFVHLDGRVVAQYEMDDFFHPESYLDKMYTNLDEARAVAETNERNKQEFFG